VLNNTVNYVNINEYVLGAVKCTMWVPNCCATERCGKMGSCYFMLFISVHMLSTVKEIQLMRNVTVYLPNFVS
jgi:hypothetical protein